MGNIPLSDIFQIKGRFQRSIHLERDFYTENALDGYVLTVTAREMLSRVVATLENEAASKAWSLTGPYGSGKSAFALFSAKLLGTSNAPATQHALELLKDSDITLYERFLSINGNREKASLGFCTVLISGERAPITRALLQGLEHGLKTFGFSTRHSLRKSIQELLKTEVKDKPPQATEITGLFEGATRAIKQKGGHGLLLVIDELGKFLEYAAQHPAQGDVFVLQTLAEFASRSAQTPLLLMTILHQTFEQYANKAGKSQQEELAKVQGRFEDIAFVEPTEQVLRLIGSAIEKTPKYKEDNLSYPIEFNLKPSQFTENEFDELMQNCLPLHPTVALVIDSIFRRFAQNERSLFAFLSSSEPYGLQDFLSTQFHNSTTLSTFSITNLYDYLIANMGNRLYASRNGKKWAEIESALGRLSDPSAMPAKLIKTIGVLSIVGEVIPNLKASESLLRYALDDKTEGFTHEFENALTTLRKRSIAIYRRYNKAYTLWEGSDIDVEAKLREAERHIDKEVSLATDLSRYLPIRPLVARRHLFETGTLRYFDIRYTDLENFDANLEIPLNDADGLILYTLPLNDYEVNQLIQKASNIKSHQNVLIAIPSALGTLQDTVTQLVSLRWVAENTPELAGDAVAREELSVQQVQAEMEASNRLAALFGGNSKDTCTWYHRGKLISLKSQRSRNVLLSEICDNIYNQTPIIRNELINRRKISGAVTTARKKLIQGILENGDKENLGITGYPAEMSIYRSLLWNTGIHRKVKVEGVWEFHPPKSDDNSKIEHTWNAIEAFLEKCEGERQPLIQLYENLMKPPLGLREGTLPILLCAVMQHYKTEIALYENDTFIPEWSMPVFERLLKVPQKFELKRFRIEGIRADVFAQFLKVLNQPEEAQIADLLTVVTPLIVQVVQLPKYTLKTQTLSEKAKNLRDIVLNAREPDTLLFEQLPKVIGFPVFSTETKSNSIIVDAFFTDFQEALHELKQAYPKLLDSVESLLASYFSLECKGEELRKELVNVVKPLSEVSIDIGLKGLITQICNTTFDFTRWLEAIANYLAKKSPKSWDDEDIEHYKINLTQLARQFRHFEAISYEKRQHTESSSGETIRVGITKLNQPEQELVVTLPSTAEERATEIESAIEKVFDEIDTDKNPKFRLAVLGRISQKLIQEFEKERTT